MAIAVNNLKSIAYETGVFNDAELLILKEVLDDCEKSNNEEYILFEEKNNDEVMGFVLFGRTPLTEFTWDVYWLVVDKKYQGRGVGAKLMNKAEGQMLAANSGKPLVIRVETSSRDDYKGARSFYEKLGYHVAGKINDFYQKNDGLVIFSKEIKPTK